MLECEDEDRKMMKFGKRRQKYGRGPSWLYTHRARPGLGVYTRLASAAIIAEPDDFPTPYPDVTARGLDDASK